jgi:hypothetical protein
MPGAGRHRVRAVILAISKAADSVRLHYGVACQCPKCCRSVRLNLAALIFAGKGDRHVHRTRPVCRFCGTVGRYQILRPDPPAPRATPPGDPARPSQQGGIWETPTGKPRKLHSRLLATV